MRQNDGNEDAAQPSLLRHLFRIMAGFVAANFVAVLLIFLLIGEASIPPDTPSDELPFLVMMMVVGTMFASVLSCVPAGLGILLTELRGIRNPAVFAVFGAACGILAYLFFAVSGSRIIWAAVELWAISVFGLAGAFAGLAYWQIVGRIAGNWR